MSTLPFDCSICVCGKRRSLSSAVCSLHFQFYMTLIWPANRSWNIDLFAPVFAITSIAFLSTNVAVARSHEQSRHVWTSTVVIWTHTVSSIPSAKTIHELVHIVGTTDDLAQILPMFQNSSGAVNLFGEIKSLISNVLMFPVFFAMNPRLFTF